MLRKTDFLLVGIIMAGTKWYVKIDGGLGRCIAATGAIEQFAKRKSAQGDKVGIVTSFAEVFEGLEYIDKIYPIGMQYLYEEFISKGEYLEVEPYNNSKYYKDEKHLAQVFNFLLNGEDKFISTKINLTEKELLDAKEFVDSQKNEYRKKMILIQPWGATGGKVINAGSKQKESENNVCIKKDCVGSNQLYDPSQKLNLKIIDDETYRSFGLEFAQVLNEMLVNNGFTTYVIKTPDQIGFNGAKTFSKLTPREIIALIPFVDGIITCDSFMHHASAALGTPAKTIVLWAGTNPKNLGYPGQINIKSWKPTEFEPNRIPHNHEYYLNKNKNSNEFKLDLIDKILEELR